MEKEGMKEILGKLNYELDFSFIDAMAERMATNKGKYLPYNWEKPMNIEKLSQAYFRHSMSIMKSEYKDEGREYGHLEAAACNLMMIMYQLKNHSEEGILHVDNVVPTENSTLEKEDIIHVTENTRSFDKTILDMNDKIIISSTDVIFCKRVALLKQYSKNNRYHIYRPIQFRDVVNEKGNIHFKCGPEYYLVCTYQEASDEVDLQMEQYLKSEIYPNISHNDFIRRSPESWKRFVKNQGLGVVLAKHDSLESQITINNCAYYIYRIK